MTISTTNIFETVLGALIIYFLTDNTKSNRALREEVIVLKTQVTFITKALEKAETVPKLSDDIMKAFKRLEIVEKRFNIKEGEL